MKRVIFLLPILILYLNSCRVIHISKYFANPDITRTSGEIQFEGLKNKVKVFRDEFGIPHIFAENENDLLIAIGYIQAQDRLWEMELVRRLSTGTLSEIVGEQKLDEVLRPAATTVEADKISRVLGFKFIGEEGETHLIDNETKIRLEAFCKGINEFIKQHQDNLPLEFRFLDFTPPLWRPAHVISISRFLAWGISDNWDVELLRYAIMQKVGEEKMWKIFPLHSDPGPFIFPEDIIHFKKKSPREFRLPLLPVDEKILRGSIDLLKSMYALSPGSGIIPQPLASNNWVVSGKLTASEKPILANDPHLPHTMPSVFYIVQLKTPEINVSGVMFPGTPFVNIGHNDFIAWGATTTFADTQDIYIEKRSDDDPYSYIYNGLKEKFFKRIETICIKKTIGKKCEDLEVLMTRHGPVINSIIPELKDSKYLFSLRWTGYEKTNEDLAFLTLAKAKGMDDFKFAMENMGSLVQNWVYADIYGNIGLSVSGLVPLRKNHDGTLPVPGWTDEYEWDGFIPYEEMPHLFNPDRGYMVSANNQCVSPDDYPYPFSYNYMSSDRALRIEELLMSKKGLTVDDMRDIQMDDLLLRGKRFAKYFIDAWENSGKKDRIVDEMVEYLRRWDFHTTSESIATTIFEEAMKWTVINTLQDEIGPELTEIYLNSDVTIATFNSILNDATSPVFDNIETPEKETRDEILVRSLYDAKKWLNKKLGHDPATWKWGKLHTLTFKHALGVLWPLSEWFNIGPYPDSGSRETVLAAFFFYGKEPYKTFVGPVLRFIIDMSIPDKARIVIDTGESGLPFTKHYKDLNRLWKEGRFITMRMDEDAKEGGETLFLVPED